MEHKVTPNIHLHLHLHECVRDFGPIYGFWLFSYERYNGMLGTFPNNHINIGKQLMSKFQIQAQLHNFVPPETLKVHFEHFLTKLKWRLND